MDQKCSTCMNLGEGRGTGDTNTESRANGRRFQPVPGFRRVLAVCPSLSVGWIVKDFTGLPLGLLGETLELLR